MNFEFALLQPVLNKLMWLTFLILIDLIGGITSALFITKDFKWDKLADFMKTYVPYRIGWLIAEFIALVPVDIIDISGFAKIIVDGIGNSTYAIIILSTFGSIFGHLSDFGLFSNKFNKIGIGKDVG